MAVEDLLGVVRLGGDVGALPELKHGLLRRRPVAAGADHDDAVPVAALEGVREHVVDGLAEPAHVLPAKRRERGHRRRVAGRVAIGLLDLGRGDDHLLGDVGDRALLRSR